MLYKVIFGFWIASTVFGFLAASYGILRASFADLSLKVGYGEGRYGEGPYGGGLTKAEEILVNVGIKTGLLPVDRTLTVVDKRRNAAWAIAGVALIGLSIVLDLWLKYLGRASQ